MYTDICGAVSTDSGGFLIGRPRVPLRVAGSLGVDIRQLKIDLFKSYMAASVN